MAELADSPDVAMGLFCAGVKKSTDGSAHYDFGHISRIFMLVDVEITGKQIGFLSIKYRIEYFVSSRFLPFIVSYMVNIQIFLHFSFEDLFLMLFFGIFYK